MINIYRRAYLALALCLPVTLVSCGNPTIQTPAPPQNGYLAVATALRQMMETDRSFVAVVIKANDQKLIPDNTARALLETADKVAKAGDQAIAMTRGLSSLPTGTKVNLWTIMRPVSDVVNGSIATGLVPIQDPDTRVTVSTMLLTMQTAIGIIQIQTAQ